MPKQVIRIVKRKHAAAAVAGEPVAAEPKRTDVGDRRDMTDTVKNWILERRENSQAEKVFSDGRIFAWNSVADTPENTG